MGLRLRVVLVSLLGYAVAVAIAGVTVARVERSRVAARAIDSTGALLHALGAPVGQTLAAGRLPELDPLVARVADRGQGLELRALAVLDARGQVVAHTQPARFGEQLDDAFTRGALASDRTTVELFDGLPVRVAAPVAAGLRWGTLVAELEPDALEARVRARQRDVVLSTVGVGLLGLLLMLVVMSVMVLAPLERIVDAARGMSAGDLGARAPENGPAELAELARTLNEAAARNQVYTATLETSVKQRTAELEEANERLQQLTTRDPHTGLFNRRRFDEALQLELDRMARSGRGFAVLMVDLDRFRAYNDTRGNLAGDGLLVNLSRLFERQIRSLDVVARYGGEEFAFLLPEVKVEGARVVAERLRAAVAAHAFVSPDREHADRVTVSIGLAVAAPLGEKPPGGGPHAVASAEQVIAAADQALFAAKESGRNRTCEATA